MTDALARLRAEIEAEIEEYGVKAELLEHTIDALRDVLTRMDRIAAECPVLAPAPEVKGRAPRRDVQGTIISAVENDPRGLTAAQIRELAGRVIGELTESACNRTLKVLVGAGKLELIGNLYRGSARAAEDIARRVPRPVETAAE